MTFLFDGGNIKNSSTVACSHFLTPIKGAEMLKETRVQEAVSIFNTINEMLGLTSCCKEKFIGFWTNGRQSVEICIGVFFYKGEGLRVPKNVPTDDPDLAWRVGQINQAISEICPSFQPQGLVEVEDTGKPVVASR